jgi:hypothetical protein
VPDGAQVVGAELSPAPQTSLSTLAQLRLPLCEYHIWVEPLAIQAANFEPLNQWTSEHASAGRLQSPPELVDLVLVLGYPPEFNRPAIVEVPNMDLIGLHVLAVSGRGLVGKHDHMVV